MKARNLIGLILALVLLSIPALSKALQPSVSQQTPDMLAIDKYLESNLQKLRIPGLALAIIKGDQVVHLKGFGVADSNNRPMTLNTPFILGSVSKSFTALAIMQLVENGKINLDEPIQHYLPWFRVADPKASAQINIRHLLNQISGISTWTGREQITDDDTSDDALERHVRNLSTAQLQQFLIVQGTVKE